jgi:hypothetical protein
MIAGLRVKLRTISGAIDLRKGLAIMLMAVAAPTAWGCFQFFNKETIVEGWYYTNWFYFLFTVRWPLAILFFSTGAIFLFTPDNRWVYLLTVPIGLAISELLWMFCATSAAQITSVRPFLGFVPFVMFAVVYVTVANWLIRRRYHTIAVIIRRIRGLVITPGIEEEKRMTLLDQESQRLLDYHEQF